uniref:Predicted DNA binding protein, CopG/RHH family n=1 Tax=Candidatus Kentrum sp. FM TaxID=2126340 RepID=A0A450S6U8_9GAMM|nr:MAG: Predicted DNA binding protein, CopG/RHH family [Candidatus Kentron sp. FM]VFJ47630.1 MAG: Predicted DNA binding protein, CopG/RHH family [Candidatus Kentron sp. FM]VFK07647.1 MAG: Predicted DNA binding protein, CopG/RHH family [Candidatus Kentron sp. FM]
MKLTQEEKDILDSVERGEWRRIPNFEQQAVRYREAAKTMLEKDKRVHIQMTEHDFFYLEKAAAHEGLPYQALITNILHKYVNGLLVEKPVGYGVANSCATE